MFQTTNQMIMNIYHEYLMIHDMIHDFYVDDMPPWHL